MIHSPHPNTGISILVIDDTPNNLRLMMQLLGDQGYQVRPVTDGSLAIKAAQLAPPDLILLDIKMPGMDGYDVCKQLKADERTCHIPIIFLTVLDDIADVVKGFSLGAVDYITKPVKTGELIARIESQLQLRSLQIQLTKQNQQLQELLTQYQSTEIALRQSEDKFSKAFERSPIPLSISSVSDGRYFAVNQEFIRKTGYTHEELIGSTVFDLNFWDDLNSRVAMFKLLKSQGYVRNFETRLRSKTGEIKDVILSVEQIQLEDASYALTAAKDVTELKNTQHKLSVRSHELSETLNRLRETQSQLIQSEKMAALGNLVAGVAHEINTPVGTAIMMASTLENSTQTVISDLTQQTLTQTNFQNYLETATEASHLILQNLNRAGELIQSFKQIAVDQTSLKARSFNVKAYLQDIIVNLSSQLKQTPHHVSISGDDSLEIYSDPGAFSQITTNLVINALMHAFPDDRPGKIHFHISSTEQQWTLTYHDNGIGIPDENRDRIFEPFFTTARHKGGSGLGLHLVYNLVTQSLNGKISVSSSENEGTTFTITFPLENKHKHPRTPS